VGEVVVDYALRLKSELAERKTGWPLSPTDVDGLTFVATGAWRGGYEGVGAMVYTGCLPRGLPNNRKATLSTTVHRQVELMSLKQALPKNH